MHISALMRWLCHLVPALIFGIGAGGCSLFHGRCSETVVYVCCDDDTGAYVGDATGCPASCPSGSSVSNICDGTPIADSGPPQVLDAGSPTPPPLMCMPARGLASCLSEGTAPANQAFVLPVEVNDCACCPDTECAVEVDRATQTLRLTTTMCPDPCDCAQCLPAYARCEVPALAEGAWNVVVNQAPAFSLQALVPAPGLVAPPPLCATHAGVDDCQLDDRLEVEPRRPDRLCVRRHSTGTVLRMETDCPSCGEILGPCLTRVEQRFTDDLPPGGEIYVDTFAGQTDCDIDCPAICQPDSLDCRTPELEAGNFYRVWYEGTVIGSFTAGGADSCFAP